MRKWFQTRMPYKKTLPKGLLTTLSFIQKMQLFFSNKGTQSSSKMLPPNSFQPFLFSALRALFLSKCGCSKHSEMEMWYFFMMDNTGWCSSLKARTQELMQPCIRMHLTATRGCSWRWWFGVRKWPNALHITRRAGTTGMTAAIIQTKKPPARLHIDWTLPWHFQTFEGGRQHDHWTVGIPEHGRG